MTLKEIKIQLEVIEEELNKNFEEQVQDVLKEAELRSYWPYETKTKSELQKEYLKFFLENNERKTRMLVRKANMLQKMLDKAQSLQHALNNINELEIVETTQSVVNKQIRKNYIDIEKCMGKYPKHMVDFYIDIFNVDIYNEEEVATLELHDGYW